MTHCMYEAMERLKYPHARSCAAFASATGLRSANRAERTSRTGMGVAANEITAWSLRQNFPCSEKVTVRPGAG